jgi:hypothetical protein
MDCVHVGSFMAGRVRVAAYPLRGPRPALWRPLPNVPRAVPRSIPRPCTDAGPSSHPSTTLPRPLKETAPHGVPRWVLGVSVGGLWAAGIPVAYHALRCDPDDNYQDCRDSSPTRKMMATTWPVGTLIFGTAIVYGYGMELFSTPTAVTPTAAGSSNPTSTTASAPHPHGP